MTSILRLAATNFLRLTLVVAALLMASGMHQGMMGKGFADRFGTGTHSEVMAGRAPVKGSPAQVLAAHKGSCWQGDEAPLTKALPTAAIIQRVGEGAAYTKRPALVDAAFKEALASAGYGDYEDARFVVVALCI